jgi:hypothetical protein
MSIKHRAVAITAIALIAGACHSSSESSTASAPGEVAVQGQGLSAAGQAWAAPAGGPDLSGRAIVVLRPGVSPRGLAAAFGAAPTTVYRHVFNGFAAALPAAAQAGLQNHPDVLSVSAVLPARAFAQQTPTGSRRIGAHAVEAPASVADVDVAVIDTGSSAAGGDIPVVEHVDCLSGTCGAPTSGGYDCPAGVANDCSHGTHVAGTIAAIDDGEGIVGVAPGARIHSVKVLDDQGYGDTESILAGMDWAADPAHGIEVANMSLGGPCGVVRGRNIFLQACDDGLSCEATTDPMKQALCALEAAGVALVVAAGNDDRDARYFYPAGYESPIVVSALADSDGLPGGLGPALSYGADDTLASFSNWGDRVDVMAPGVAILSHTRDGLERWSGTSMASPHVAGVAARYIAAHPGAALSDVVAAVVSGEADPCVDAASCVGSSDDQPEPLVNVGAPGCASNGECESGDLCLTQSCDAGACVDSGATACSLGEGLDAQCNAAYCDPDTGSCTVDALDGAACDDGDPGTCEDTCAAGTCAGSVDACGGGEACVDPPSCSQDSDCCSGKCRANGRWAGTCA